MKKYIVPDTETMEVIWGSIICNSNDGVGSGEDPTSPPSGKPNGAPIYLG